MNEAKRVTKPGGKILVAYCMNEYSILTYGFKQNHIKRSCKSGKSYKKIFIVCLKKEDLYDYVRVEDIDKIRKATDLEQDKTYLCRRTGRPYASSIKCDG